MKKVWHYHGDNNLENGGSFYCLENLPNGYAEAIRIYPCGVSAPQDNCWWVDEHIVHIPERQEVLETALLYCGAPPNLATELGQVIALHEYGEYEQESGITVQIGPDYPYYNGLTPVEPDVKLRAGTDLEKWVRRKYKLGRKK